MATRNLISHEVLTAAERAAVEVARTQAVLFEAVEYSQMLTGVVTQ
jgi:hypothetical protein